MSLRTLVIRKLEGAAGQYAPNHFLLTLDPGTPFIALDKADKPVQQKQYISVFLHEYWHFFHNISTIAGFKTFAFTQHLLAIFQKTLLQNADGTSEGASALSDEEARNALSLLKLYDGLDGDPGPQDWHKDFDLTFRVLAVREEDQQLSYQTRPAPNPTVILEVESTWPDGTIAQDEFRFGSYAVEESVVYAVERQLASAVEDDGSVPEFPYRAAERLFEHVVQQEPKLGILAALGTTALMMTHPGPGFLFLLRCFKVELDSGKSESESLKTVLEGVGPTIVEVIDKILTADLPELVVMHAGRGLSASALEFLATRIEAALNRRKAGLLFDLAPVFPVVDVPSLLALQDEFPPCDAIQERSGNPTQVERDLLFSFDPTPPDGDGHRPTDFLRSLQAQQEFVAAHLHPDTGEFIESSSASAPCPFFTTCHLDMRRNSPDRCESEPWTWYSDGSEGCWYSTAIAATLGPVTIRKKT